MSEDDYTESGGSNSASTVVTDAAHPLFLEPPKKSVTCTAKPPKYQCPQCNERLINKGAFLKKHFEKTPHKSVSQCPSCNGNVYPYLDHGTMTAFHKCRKKEALVKQDLNSNFTAKYTQRSNSM